MENKETNTHCHLSTHTTKNLQRKYGLITATAIIVGTVVGSGIFFRTGRLLNNVGGQVGLGLLAWLLGGAIMFVCAFVFSMMAQKYEKVNGIMDYSEALVGKKYSYGTGWFLSILYAPAVTSIVAWVAATYTAVLFGIPATIGDSPNPEYNPFVFTLTFVYVVSIFVINFFSPKLAGKFQVSTTFIKLIPLILMGIVGIIYGLVKGVDLSSLSNVTNSQGEPLQVAFFSGIVTTAYAYDGWSCIGSLNSEIKNSKRNMPLALLIGSLLIVSVYVLYFLGISMAGNSQDLINNNFTGTESAFVNIFGRAGSVILIVFVIISCLGSVNGNTMSSSRMSYAMGCRHWGIAPKAMAEVSKTTDVPFNSTLFALFMSCLWIVILLCSELGWFGRFYFDIGDIAVIGFYLLCLPIFTAFVIQESTLQWYKRFLLPILAVIAAGFMVVALFLDNWQIALIYFGTIAAIMLLSLPFYHQKSTPTNESISTPII